MTAGPATPGSTDRVDLVAYTLRLGDDTLVFSQRLGEWIAASPQLEQDVAIGNIALDLLGQARALLSYAGAVEGRGRDEDVLAYFRDERDFTNVHLVEGASRGDFAITMARLLVFASYQHQLYGRLAGSSDETLAAIAAKAVKEVDYHRDHATQWVLRLGDGTQESHRRMQAALDAVWPDLDELFESDDLVRRLPGVAVDPADLEQPVRGYLRQVLDRATLTVPDVRPAVTGGRRGIHSEVMGFLLAEMQHLARSHPGAQW
ncbi:MAG TPA: 1,2-phenylacetyl-CoA epoxidase subunit PaaC [Nocardioidaceae bacterium]|nr:1,2-phenylacetyl-CoA epoxidase subunit PaaC [Nocardioidaceae bacterium]